MDEGLLRTRAHLALAVSVVVGAMLWPLATASAHHSFSMFDREKMATISGTVRAYEWSAPHVYIWVYVPNDKGSEDTWGVEVGGGPNMLARRGWTRTTLQKGDKVTLLVHPLRDGRTGGQFMSMTLADGQVFKMGGGADQ